MTKAEIETMARNGMAQELALEDYKQIANNQWAGYITVNGVDIAVAITLTAKGVCADLDEYDYDIDFEHDMFVEEQKAKAEKLARKEEAKRKKAEADAKKRAEKKALRERKKAE